MGWVPGRRLKPRAVMAARKKAVLSCRRVTSSLLPSSRSNTCGAHVWPTPHVLPVWLWRGKVEREAHRTRDLKTP